MRTFLIRLALLAAPFMAIPAHAQRIAFVDTKSADYLREVAESQHIDFEECH